MDTNKRKIRISNEKLPDSSAPAKQFVHTVGRLETRPRRKAIPTFMTATMPLPKLALW